MERDLEQGKADYQQLLGEARDYQARLERDVEQGKADYRKLLRKARDYQAHLERDVEQGKADYQKLLRESQQQIRDVSQERDRLTQALERCLCSL